MRKIHVFSLLGILAIGTTLFFMLKPPVMSPYHPFVGTWELERGDNEQYQRIVLTPGQRVKIHGAIQGEWTGAPALVTMDTNDSVVHYSIHLRRNRLHFYHGDDVSFVYKRINNCWSPSHPHNICE